MASNQPDFENIQRAVANALHQHWKLYLAEGIVLVILGLMVRTVVTILSHPPTAW